MVKLRIVNGIPEIDADAKELISNRKEIVALLRELNAPHQFLQTMTLDEKSSELQELQENDQDVIDAPYPSLCPPLYKYPELPSDPEEIAKMIDTGIKPIRFSLRQQQERIWGRVINSRKEPNLYWRLYSIHQSAMKILSNKYGGIWDEGKNEKINGLTYTFYTLIEGDNEENAQSKLELVENHENNSEIERGNEVSDN